MPSCFQSIPKQVLKASANNDLRTLERILETHPSLPSIINLATRGDGLNALLLATKYGHLEIIKFLLGRLQADPNVRNWRNGQTSLHLAAQLANRIDVINTLLDFGADPLVLTYDGETAVDVARLWQNCKAVRALEQRTAVFVGFLKMRQFTYLQQGMGMVLGKSEGNVGAQVRDRWVVVTNTYSLVAGDCPTCKTKLDKRLGLLPGLKCRQCQAELSGNTQVITEVREIAVYTAQSQSKPEQCYTFDGHEVPVDRVSGNVFVPVRKASKSIQALSAAANANVVEKLVFSQKHNNTNAFVQCIKTPAVLAVDVTMRPRQQDALQQQQQQEEEEEAQWDIPQGYLCPLSNQVMEDPVLTSDGMCFDRKNILEYFAQLKSATPTSPLTGQVLASKELTPNAAVKNAIEEWRKSFQPAVDAVAVM